MTTERRVPIEIRDFSNNNGSLDEDPDDEDNRNRKPSYVGLSCSVSGYSTYIRYTSPSRKTSPPGQTFHVATGPQVLNFNEMKQTLTDANSPPPVRGQELNGFDATDFRKGFNNNNREGSPGGSDTSSIGSSTSSGNLVQKQIERLFGGRVQSLRLTSPEPLQSSTDSSPEADKSYSRRTQVSPGSPLELKTLKVPAVFRLLRPEFREQLKSNSCQVQIPSEPTNGSSANGGRFIPITKDRIIPIQIEKKKCSDRIIPVEVNGTPLTSRTKPALPAKPTSPNVRSPLSSPIPAKEIALELQCQEPVEEDAQPTTNGEAKHVEEPTSSHSEEPIKNAEESLAEKPSELIEEDLTAHHETFPEPEDIEDQDDEETQFPCAGVRERTLLCPIQEEDTESTASAASSVCMKRSGANLPSAASGADAGVEEEVRDGHYFIKILENEIFKFEEQICDFEEDLTHAEAIPEDIRDCILAAVGKAKLLMGQKLMQFRGLCDKNIHSNSDEDPFVPTSEDLAGFWDMVFIQIEHIHSLFAELVVIRQNGWKKPEEELKPKTEAPVAPRNGKVKAKAQGQPAAGKKSEAAKARDEARKKLLEEKKRQMKQKQSSSSNEMFVQIC